MSTALDEWDDDEDTIDDWCDDEEDFDVTHNDIGRPTRNYGIRIAEVEWTAAERLVDDARAKQIRERVGEQRSREEIVKERDELLHALGAIMDAQDY